MSQVRMNGTEELNMTKSKEKIQTSFLTTLQVLFWSNLESYWFSLWLYAE